MNVLSAFLPLQVCILLRLPIIMIKRPRDRTFVLGGRGNTCIRSGPKNPPKTLNLCAKQTII